jgi:hypothetical protein
MYVYIYIKLCMNILLNKNDLAMYFLGQVYDISLVLKKRFISLKIQLWNIIDYPTLWMLLLDHKFTNL